MDAECSVAERSVVDLILRERIADDPRHVPTAFAGGGRKALAVLPIVRAVIALARRWG